MTLPAVVILAGGLATRLHPITKTIPKALVEVADKPFIFHQLDLLRHNGISRVVLCVGYLGEMIQETLGDGSEFGVRIDYSFDGSRLLGTAGAIKRALPLLENEFFILYGDSYLDCDYQAVYRVFAASRQPALMTVCHNTNQWDQSNILFDKGRIILYDKRQPTPQMEHVDYGLSLAQQNIFDGVPLDAPSDLADIFHNLSTQGRLAGFEIHHRFYEIGSPQGLEETHRYLLSKLNQS